MSISSLFNYDNTQVVCLPADMRFPDSIKRVEVHIKGLERAISPATSSWDSFFLEPSTPTPDFMSERDSQ